MVRVLRHGNLITVVNPIDGSETQMRNVVFVEEGRSGGNYGMSESTKALNDALGGADVGLNTLRTHTHPVKIDKLGLFPEGKELNLFINREMHSTAQMRQQENVEMRMVNGKPTYFKTELSSQPKDDVDMRLPNEILVSVRPELFFKAQVGAARVVTNQLVVNPASEKEELVQNPL